MASRYSERYWSRASSFSPFFCGLADAYARQLPRVRRKVTRDRPISPKFRPRRRLHNTGDLDALSYCTRPALLQEFRNLLFLPITPGRNARYLCPYLIVFVPADSIPHPDPPPLPSRSLYVLTRSRDLMRARYADYAAAPLAQVHVVRPSVRGRGRRSGSASRSRSPPHASVEMNP